MICVCYNLRALKSDSSVFQLNLDYLFSRSVCHASIRWSQLQKDSHLMSITYSRGDHKNSQLTKKAWLVDTAVWNICSFAQDGRKHKTRTLCYSSKAPVPENMINFDQIMSGSYLHKHQFSKTWWKRNRKTTIQILEQIYLNSIHLKQTWWHFSSIFTYWSPLYLQQHWRHQQKLSLAFDLSEDIALQLFTAGGYLGHRS